MGKFDDSSSLIYLAIDQSRKFSIEFMGSGMDKKRCAFLFLFLFFSIQQNTMPRLFLCFVVFVVVGVVCVCGEEWYVDNGKRGGGGDGTRPTTAFGDMKSAFAVAVSGDTIIVIAETGPYPAENNTNLEMTSAFHSIIIRSYNDKKVVFDVSESQVPFLKTTQQFDFYAYNISVSDLSFTSQEEVPLFDISSAHFYLSDCLFTSSHPLHISQTNVSIRDSHFIGGKTHALELFDVIGNITNVVFSNHGASSIFVSFTENNIEKTPSLYFKNSNFTENDNRNNGGKGAGVHIFIPDGADGNVTFWECFFTKNLGVKGGGLYVEGGRVDLSRCSFDDNRADFGGALFGEDANFLFESKITFHSNQANEGGAVYTKNSLIDSLLSAKYINNFAKEGGAAKHFFSEVNLKERYSANICEKAGGAVSLVGATGRVDGTFEDNKCENNNNSSEKNFTYGGGLYCDQITNLSSGEAFFDNNQADFGGGMYISPTATIKHDGGRWATGLEFKWNTANINGGAIALYGIFKTTESRHLLFCEDNKAKKRGGCIYTNRANYIYGGRLTGNTAEEGHGIFADNTGGELIIQNFIHKAGSKPSCNIHLEGNTPAKLISIEPMSKLCLINHQGLVNISRSAIVNITAIGTNSKEAGDNVIIMEKDPELSSPMYREIFLQNKQLISDGSGSLNALLANSSTVIFCNSSSSHSEKFLSLQKSRFFSSSDFEVETLISDKNNTFNIAPKNYEVCMKGTNEWTDGDAQKPIKLTFQFLTIKEDSLIQFNNFNIIQKNKINDVELQKGATLDMGDGFAKLKKLITDCGTKFKGELSFYEKSELDILCTNPHELFEAGVVQFCQAKGRSTDLSYLGIDDVSEDEPTRVMKYQSVRGNVSSTDKDYHCEREKKYLLIQKNQIKSLQNSHGAGFIVGIVFIVLFIVGSLVFNYFLRRKVEMIDGYGEMFDEETEGGIERNTSDSDREKETEREIKEEREIGGEMEKDLN